MGWTDLNHLAINAIPHSSNYNHLSDPPLNLTIKVS